LEFEKVIRYFYENLKLWVLLIFEIHVEELKYSLAILGLMQNFYEAFNTGNQLSNKGKNLPFYLNSK